MLTTYGILMQNINNIYYASVADRDKCFNSFAEIFIFVEIAPYF